MLKEYVSPGGTRVHSHAYSVYKDRAGNCLIQPAD